MNEISIKYGMLNLRDERPDALHDFKYLLDDITGIKKQYISFGFHLHEFCLCKYFEDFGYDNFFEFCEDNLGLNKSFVSRCINVWYEFSEHSDHVHKMWIDEKYKKYNYSQLCEMLSMNSDERKLVNPDMTVKEIRSLKSSIKSVATSQQNKSTTSKNIIEDDVNKSTTSKNIIEDEDNSNEVCKMTLYNFLHSLSKEDLIGYILRNRDYFSEMFNTKNCYIMILGQFNEYKYPDEIN